MKIDSNSDTEGKPNKRAKVLIIHTPRMGDIQYRKAVVDNLNNYSCQFISNAGHKSCKTKEEQIDNILFCGKLYKWQVDNKRFFSHPCKAEDRWEVNHIKGAGGNQVYVVHDSQGNQHVINSKLVADTVHSDQAGEIKETINKAIITQEAVDMNLGLVSYIHK